MWPSDEEWDAISTDDRANEHWKGLEQFSKTLSRENVLALSYLMWKTFVENIQKGNYAIFPRNFLIENRIGIRIALNLSDTSPYMLFFRSETDMIYFKTGFL